MTTTILDGETYTEALQRRYAEEAKTDERMNIIELAKEADIYVAHMNKPMTDKEVRLAFLERFAALVRAEYEAPLKLAEEALNAMLTHMGMDEDEWTKPTFNQAREALATIRAARAQEQAEQEPVAFADKYGNVMKAKEKLTSTNVRDNWYDRPLYEKAAFDADLYSVAGKLALELECLLLDTKDLSVVSKWWDSAHDALEQWRTIKYAAPVRTKDLTDVEIAGIHGCPPAEWVIRFARAVISADREKNK